MKASAIHSTFMTNILDRYLFKKNKNGGSVDFVWKNKRHCINCTERNIQSIQVLFLESNQLNFLSLNRMSL